MVYSSMQMSAYYILLSNRILKCADMSTPHVYNYAFVTVNILLFYLTVNSLCTFVKVENSRNFPTLKIGKQYVF